MKSVDIRISGAAGQGVQTAADLLGKAATRAGLFAYGYSDAESRIRGGRNFSHIRIATQPCMGVHESVDLLLELNQPDLTELAEKAGSKKAVNTAAAATACALAGVPRVVTAGVVAERFSGPHAEANARTVALAYENAERHEAGDRFRMSAEDQRRRLWVGGHQAIALGAVAGGVRFYAGYPMSPSTGIMTSLAAWSREAGVLVEQAEDEIAAVNMVAGASYAGARSMTATSGGGFCLMTEGVSLLGMIEAPAVMVLAPGPATGLPTRTAQGDLLLALHAGHGFFPRVILAPQNLADGFELTARAFDIAERFQVPVLILTDQLLQDSQASVDPFDVSGRPTERHLLTAEQLASVERYRRYDQTDSGISPQAAPGVSGHTVVVDSDEHDEDGHPIEAAEIADRMAAKRIRKAASLQNATLLPPPEIAGDPDGQPLVVSWGSTYETIREVPGRGRDFAHLHLRRLLPLDGESLADLFRRASSLIVVECSVGGELAALLQGVTLHPVDHTVTRRDGRPFSVEDLARRLGEVLP
jgi:2-oxoglutarate ferredoxin oxidoreductase subunit alpha